MSIRPAHIIDLLKTGNVKPLDLAADLFHLALRHDRGQFERSVRNCHVPGLDSIVLFDGDEGMVRFYLAHGGQHGIGRLIGDDGHFTVGIHNHKYEIAKLPLTGRIYNVRTKVVSSSDFRLHEYGFKSALRGGGMELTDPVERPMEPVRYDRMKPGDYVVMQPEDLHTVTVADTGDVAWLVIEGPNVDIDSLIYSPRHDLKLSPEGLYQPIPVGEAREIAQRVADETPW